MAAATISSDKSQLFADVLAIIQGNCADESRLIETATSLCKLFEQHKNAHIVEPSVESAPSQPVVEAQVAVDVNPVAVGVNTDEKKDLVVLVVKASTPPKIPTADEVAIMREKRAAMFANASKKRRAPSALVKRVADTAKMMAQADNNFD